MDIVNRLLPDTRTELEAALDAYVEAKRDLLRSSTRVLGSFISTEFVEEMQSGTLALLGGLCQGGEQAGPLFAEAKKRFEAMAFEGAMELADEYVNSVETEQRLKVVAGLFPEMQERLLGPYNRAIVFFNRALSRELSGDEARRRILEAVHLLRDSELVLGEVSDLDMEQRVEQRRRSMWDLASRLVFWSGVVFLVVRAIGRAGGLHHLLRLAGLA